MPRTRNASFAAASTNSLAGAKEDLTGRLIATFKQLISEGVLAPGCKLPAERDLAESFGVARSSLRQALKVLEIMGVISQRVGDGTYLNAGAASILGEPMEFLILIDGISFHELMEARLLVEPALAARAATRATSEDLAALRRAIAAMSQYKLNRAQFVEADLQFHQAIFRAAGNRVCTRMFTVVHKSVMNLIDVTAKLVDPQHTIDFHKKIYGAIRRRNPEEARRRMEEHLTDAANLLMRAAAAQAKSRLRSRITLLAGRSGEAPAVMAPLLVKRARRD